MKNELPLWFTENKELITSLGDICTIICMSITVLYFVSWLFGTAFHKKTFVKEHIYLVNMINSFLAVGLIVMFFAGFDDRSFAYLCVFVSHFITIGGFAAGYGIVRVIKYIHTLKDRIEEKRNHYGS